MQSFFSRICILLNYPLFPPYFPLGHELTHLYPKKALAWYAVGCYYYTCGGGQNYDLAKKYLIKCTKIEKRYLSLITVLNNFMYIVYIHYAYILSAHITYVIYDIYIHFILYIRGHIYKYIN